MITFACHPTRTRSVISLNVGRSLTKRAEHLVAPFGPHFCFGDNLLELRVGSYSLYRADACYDSLKGCTYFFFRGVILTMVEDLYTIISVIGRHTKPDLGLGKVQPDEQCKTQ